MRNEYPRPDVMRESFISLGGEWDFDFDDSDLGHKEKWYLGREMPLKIFVPFCFEAKLSGIGDTSFRDSVWYHKEVAGLSLKKDENYILRFDGVDYYGEVYIGGRLKEKHYGRQGGFNIEIDREDLEQCSLAIPLFVYDPCKDRSIPHGKQDQEEKSCARWYMRTSGIYRAIFLQKVSWERIEILLIDADPTGYELNIYLKSTIDSGIVKFDIDDGNDILSYLMNLSKSKDEFHLLLTGNYVNDRVWSLEKPFLFRLKISLFDSKSILKDKVSTYFGFRKISSEDGYVTINGRKIYQKLLLNQGYYPDGILTAPSIEGMERDIDNMEAMGFNRCRIHQKCEDPYFLYLCYTKGFIVRQECVASYGDDLDEPKRVIDERIDIVKTNYNPASIVSYTPLNESWSVEGITYDKRIQSFAMSLYYLIKSIDGTCLVVSNDGSEQCKTDLITVHSYGHGEEEDNENYESFKSSLKNRKSILNPNDIDRFILNPGYDDLGQPILLNKFGGAAFKSDPKGTAWGDKTAKDDDYLHELSMRCDSSKRVYKRDMLNTI